MKKFLLPEGGQFYKANMHCHTTVSDGKLTPEEIKRAYMERGYSVVAYTDHNVLIDHQDLTDEHFVALNGFEMDVDEELGENPAREFKACHICMVALTPDNLTHFCFDPSYVRIGNAKQYLSEIKTDGKEFRAVYTPECISEMMETGRARGFYVTYNHPEWSMEGPEEYLRYHGMHAMEIYNFGCNRDLRDEYNAEAYDRMLCAGKRICCVGGDDNHNHHAFESWKNDSFGAFTMIKAEKLDYQSIARALERGEFYASQGPEITGLWVEDGVLHVTCSEAQRVILSGAGRRRLPFGKDNGEAVTHASFPIGGMRDFVRVSVVGFDGKRANTRAYFLDEMVK